MPRSLTVRLLFLFVLLSLSICAPAQTQTPPPPQQPDEVLRINTDLVQTDVMVFDQKGRFVGGLKPEQFELMVDEKPHAIAFFEQVRAGSTKEQRLLAKEKTENAGPKINETRGRTVIFFVDDLHLAPDSLERTRRTLKQFINTEMSENDRVAIASTSGDLGFLQQFTDSQAMLPVATERLIHHPYNVKEMTDSRTPMTEYTALAIERNEDPAVLDFYVERCLREAYPLRYRKETCELQVKSRARLMLLQSASVTLNTYAALESLMHSASLLPGRKLVFFFSDGFLLDTGPRNASPREKLKQITDAALRSGVAVYTIDARGLFSGQLDATNNVAFDKQNRLDTTTLREGAAMQDALNALARDTGGRALRNQNYFDRWVNKILDETSEYYLLAWRPDDQSEIAGTFRNIAVRVVDHPEYEVRLPRGFLKTNSVAVAKPSAEVSVEGKIHHEVQQALTSLNPRREIPTSLSVIFLDTPEHGPVLTASVQVSNEALAYETRGDKQAAAVDVVGVVVNDRGKPAGSFQTRLNINSIGGERASKNSETIYNSRLSLTPGLYQVRVATRDVKSGQIGSAQQWVEIPNLALKQLSLSSLLLGVQSVTPSAVKTSSGSEASQVQFSVDHHFARNSHVGFMAFVYNAKHEGRTIPNLSFQAQLFQMGRLVLTTRVQTISMAAQDQARILCTGEIPLGSIPAGQYTLELTVTDEIAGTSTTQHTRIRVE